MNKNQKILFIGPMGAGKTTAISSISDEAPVATEAKNSARHLSDKPTTTVAMDFGQIELGTDQSVDLYGIPGQEHFNFLWPLLEKGSLGAILLLDCSKNDSLDSLALFCNAFSDLCSKNAVVVALNRITHQSVYDCQNWLSSHDLTLPVIIADPRKRNDVLMLVELLIANAEAEMALAGEWND